MLFSYATACGFVLAAILATGYQLFTDRPARFEMLSGDATGALYALILKVFLVVWAAPYIIMRNAVRGRLIERRPLGWLFASFTIASIWSGCVGILVLSIAVALS